jgi:hypothetical protein
MTESESQVSTCITIDSLMPNSDLNISSTSFPTPKVNTSTPNPSNIPLFRNLKIILQLRLKSDLGEIHHLLLISRRSSKMVL